MESAAHQTGRTARMGSDNMRWLAQTVIGAILGFSGALGQAADASATISEISPVIISVDAEGNYAVNGEPVKSRADQLSLTNIVAPEQRPVPRPWCSR